MFWMNAHLSMFNNAAIEGRPYSVWIPLAMVLSLDAAPQNFLHRPPAPHSSDRPPGSHL